MFIEESNRRMQCDSQMFKLKFEGCFKCNCIAVGNNKFIAKRKNYEYVILVIAYG